MNYLSSFLNWSDEPPNATNQPPNQPPPNNECNTYSEPTDEQQQYISPLSSLARIEPDEDSQSQHSIISALWGSSSSSQLLHKKQSPQLSANTFININNTYNNNTYLPSITCQQQINNIIPPSYPSAISVTASPPPIMISNNNYNNINYTKNKQIKFTPKYKKKRILNSSPYESVDKNINDNYNNKSTLLDVVDININVDIEEKIQFREDNSPPVRAPIKPYKFTKLSLISNESDEFANDIVKPHPGYNNNNNNNGETKQVNQSTTNYINFESEKANDNNNNVMVSILGNNLYDTQEISKQISNNHLIPENNNLPMLIDGEVDNEEDEQIEVNLQLYGFNLFDDNDNDNCDTTSVVSDFEEAGILMKSNSSKKQNKYNNNNKIRVKCNNCYLWRHYTNKLDIELINFKFRNNELEQNINLAENKEQSVIRHYDELKEENDRLKLKNNELKQDMNLQKEELTNKLIEYRKKKENEINILNKQYQSLMKKKNVLELCYNEQVNIVNIKQAEIEKYTNELNSIQLKHDRLDNDIIQERNKIIAMNLKEKSMKTNLNKLQKKIDEQRKINTNEMGKQIEDLDLRNEINEINENKIMEYVLEINNLSDKLTDTKDENLRLINLQNKQNEQLNEIEQQLKHTNIENDKLMDENYELNGKINKKKLEMDEYKNEMYSINNAYKEYKDEIKILRIKLESATCERDKKLSKNVRLNNRVKALQNENNSLHLSISHLESIIENTYGLACLKDRKLNKLKRENNENQLIVDRLKNRMKKHDKQKTSYRNLEMEWGKKSHRKMDKKLDMVRQSNVQLQNENDELNQTNKQLNININELKSQLKEEKMKCKSRVNKYESDLSQLKAENHKIYSDKINSEADLEITKEENNKLINNIKQLHEKLSKKKIICPCNICMKHPLKYLIHLNIKTDEKYKFIERCRNIFINTNKLTPKLIMQLIESYFQCIIIFHEIKTKCNYFVNKLSDHLTLFYNLQENILDKYTKTGILISSIKSSIKSPISPRTDASSSSFSSLYSDIEKKRSKSNLKKFNKNKIAKIRKPIQNKKPPFHDAYYSIYKLLKEDITNALHNMEYVSDMYQKPLDYKYYEFDEKQNNKNENENEIDLDDNNNNNNNIIDYNRLLINPSTERYQLQEMIKNNEKFDNVIKKFNASAKELRKLNAQTNVELDVAWHSYYLNENISIDFDDNKMDFGDNNNNGKDEYDMDYDIHNDMMEMDSNYFELMKKINKSGPEKHKRFSIT